MNIYIDKPNLLSVIHSARDEKYRDCMRMLKNNFNIFFSFKRDDIKNFDDVTEKPDVMSWLTMMTSGVGKDNDEPIKWGCTFPNPLDISSLNAEELSSIYCLANNRDAKLEAYANKGNLIIALEGKEIDAISSLFFDDFQFTEDIFHEISSWADLDKYTSPCTDIIISDPYIFSSPELYQQNVYSLIKVLTQKVKNSKVNIVIFTLKSHYDRISNTLFEPNWDTIYSKIRKCADKYSTFNVTFVTASKETLDEHDRTIFTNYKYYSSGDTYNYFNSNGERITRGRNLHVHSRVKKLNEKNSCTFLNDMQQIINRIKKKNNDALIKKDRISNFLIF